MTEAAQTIRAIRGKMSQEAFAERVGVSRALISYWEHGRTKPDFDAILALLRLASPEQKQQLADHFDLRERLQVLIDELGVRIDRDGVSAY